MRSSPTVTLRWPVSLPRPCISRPPRPSNRSTAIESSQPPVATFVSTQIDGLPETYAEGEGISFQVTGDLTVREITVKTDDIPAASIGTISVDISQFASHNNRRDNALRNRFLESATYPVATFVPTQVDGLPETYNEGESISFQVTGDLTVREVTQPVTFDVTVAGTPDEFTGEAETTILMSDFGIGPISIAGILNTEDEIKLSFTFVARP
jgi:polyisoprenoid-binding protein YceI